VSGTSESIHAMRERDPAVEPEPAPDAASTPLDPLTNHRRAMLYAALLLAAVTLLFVGVGKHPGAPGTSTTWPAIGRFDGDIYRLVQEHRNAVVTSISKALNLLGSGVVTIPLRIVVAIYLVFRRHWRALAVWILAWVAAEVILSFAKGWFMRSRPPLPLVVTSGYSFPSGHAVAGAAIAVALVLVLMPAGPRRRKWEVLAASAAFVMALSRVYLNAHWFSDVLAGVLLGAGVALGAAALVTEIRDMGERRRGT
jgi:membrane-associated phospholipid phosphatase